MLRLLGRSADPAWWGVAAARPAGAWGHIGIARRPGSVCGVPPAQLVAASAPAGEAGVLAARLGRKGSRCGAARRWECRRDASTHAPATGPPGASRTRCRTGQVAGA